MRYGDLKIEVENLGITDDDEIEKIDYSRDQRIYCGVPIKRETPELQIIKKEESGAIEIYNG